MNVVSKFSLSTPFDRLEIKDPDAMTAVLPISNVFFFPMSAGFGEKGGSELP